MSYQIGLECVGDHHLWFTVRDEQNIQVASWCPWCGTGVYNPDRITDDSQPVGFTPQYGVEIPDGWRRRIKDYPP